MGTKALRVLVVEDEALVAMALSAALTDMGMDVSWVARTGPQAVELAMRHSPDLVTMDGRLAEGTCGMRAATDITRMLGIPVVMVSADLDEHRAAAAGAAAFIAKPFTLHTLHRAMSPLAARLQARQKAAS